MILFYISLFCVLWICLCSTVTHTNTQVLMAFYCPRARFEGQWINKELMELCYHVLSRYDLDMFFDSFHVCSTCHAFTYLGELQIYFTNLDFSKQNISFLHMFSRSKGVFVWPFGSHSKRNFGYKFWGTVPTGDCMHVFIHVARYHVRNIWSSSMVKWNEENIRLPRFFLALLTDTRYLYWPLGGKNRTWLAVPVVFLFVGFWHERTGHLESENKTSRPPQETCVLKEVMDLNIAGR